MHRLDLCIGITQGSRAEGRDVPLEKDHWQYRYLNVYATRDVGRHIKLGVYEDSLEVLTSSGVPAEECAYMVDWSSFPPIRHAIKITPGYAPCKKGDINVLWTTTSDPKGLSQEQMKEQVHVVRVDRTRLIKYISKLQL